ncbi:hypothetical protein GOV07_06000 [Candidatus Woesearchaeota archaeon]|nr:hypothetical protein [Candidatus Woesearchaeota archaeon]
MGDGEIASVYLHDTRILPWERPLPEGSISMLHMYNGSTIPREMVGLDVLDETVDRFRIVVSATKYLADVARTPEDNPHYFGGKRTIPKEVILFSGVIAIYQDGEVPGTEFAGYNLAANGEIWIATPNNKVYSSSDGLKNLVLGESEHLSRIEAIAQGFQSQEEAMENARHRAQNDSWQRGRRAGEDRRFRF